MSVVPPVLPAISAAIMITCFFAIAFGFIFKDMLEYQVALWNIKRQTQATINYKNPSLIVAYLALTVFMTLFVGECLSVFQLGYLFASILAVVVVIPTALLVWVQLGEMLKLLAIGGSKAIDIDSYLSMPELEAKAKK
ncbi:hypothetical protein K4A83_19145 [Spirulina subsalsa FACHB-351]|uniref:Uncharacterized protein n=1 Tax=Spirulina subsalsa FACHB-351 TaxID=234711 RepID=A0ABT3LA53_9CYAN|nr:hypothetical protein [Spirulina subsalsa]MCW6038373.1 hypothetical protein [Spirulina subsalsa FACHB-351]